MRMARSKPVFSLTSLPTNGFVPSALMGCMLEAWTRNFAGVEVVYSKSGIGKSIAGIMVLNRASRGIMFGGKARSDGIYWKKVASQLDIPEQRDFQNFDEWVQVLVQCIAETPAEENEHTGLLQSGAALFQRVCRACTGTDEVENELALPPEFDFDLPSRPVLIFDDFDQVTDEDINFISVVYNMADVYKVLVFVLTSRRDVANKLCKLNHWRRVRPLAGLYDASIPRVTLADDTYADPTWNDLEWSQGLLRRLLKCHGYTQDDINSLDPQNNENPWDLLLRAQGLRTALTFPRVGG